MTEDGYYICSKCNQLFVFDKRKKGTWKSRHFFEGLPYCKKCFNLMKDTRRKKRDQQIKEIGMSLNIPVTNCKIIGTCEILKAHHNILINDPERLETEFLINLICGADGVKKYKASKTPPVT